MKRAATILLAAAVCTAGAAGCTPRPRDAEPTASAFLDALAQQNYDEIASLVDAPSAATGSIRETMDGLQADGASVELKEVRQQDNLATATYSVDWRLPHERTLTYDAQMTLTQANGEWTVRWQPSVLNPNLGAGQHLELRAEESKPASVLSSDGAELLSPGVAYRLLVDTNALPTATAREDAAERIAAALGQAAAQDPAVPTTSAADLAGELGQATGTYSVVLVPASARQAVADAVAGVPGVRLNEEAAIVNADPTFAPDIMARVGQLVGSELEGRAGWNVSVVNEHGAALEKIAGEDPVPAPALKISLDHTVQRAAEKALEPLAGQQAMIVAIRPSTGGVLAVAQTPAADREGNIATMGQYPPGSTFKIITAAAGLELAGLTPGTTVPCPGTMNLYGRVVTNYAGFSLGSVPLETAFARSCNTTFADVSTKLEPGQLAGVGKQFGLGRDLKIPGLDTITGSIPEGHEPLERTEAGYGQGADLASPFGMALVSATAAHGSMPVPYLIDGQRTEVSDHAEPPTPETIAQLQQIMGSVTAPGGTAAGMKAAGDIRGKTGEAEINQGSHAWFTGYRADDDIAFATLIVLGGGSESAVAATDRMLLNIDEMRGRGGI
ncbi:penicillin-binding transpeptidase domain-containing protein [Corynebacterium liangguodongii]|uniref:Cell division protein FtsI n=1 Tax=Corynebacterium liangguodongii TaxID=2079535 RepID=A0A2S0WEQ1_9CORY|nr:penicillin-binding transpeptidase domain-containing protein [Corynebacterium liangguodongii]AWB84239.1 cell division protein FtsI [Corynebacterium liangguodongii]PWC00248.1 cell division protein FtsI [Corynebacterium liangguodongii]